MNNTAVYMRVSTNDQSTDSQELDLRRWLDHEGVTGTWYVDKYTGATMSRPQWERVEDAIERGIVRTLLVWRLDRLGRTTIGLLKVFEMLQARQVRLVCLMDNLDFQTASGRLHANMLASFAAYERELISERVKKGIEARRRRDPNYRHGGSAGTVFRSLSPKKVNTIIQLFLHNTSKAAIAEVIGCRWLAVHSTLRRFAFTKVYDDYLSQTFVAETRPLVKAKLLAGRGDYRLWIDR